MGLIKILTGLMFVSIFAIAIISYASNFADDNETYINIDDDTEVTNLQSDIEGQITTFRTSSNKSSTILQRSKIKSGDENVEGGGQFKVASKDGFNAIKNIIEFINIKVFGGDTSLTVVTTTFLSLLAVILGLYIWKVWKGGNPD